jgi:hypothetical protein
VRKIVLPVAPDHQPIGSIAWGVISGRFRRLRGEAQLYTSYTPPPKASFKAPAASAAEHAAALTLDESIGR